MHIAFFKSKIRAFHFAVYQAQALAVAQGLGADDRAVVKGYVLAVPGQILSLDHAVSHHHVPGMPERVLGIEAAVFKGRVFDVLERIFSLEGYIGKMQVGGAHHEILALCGAVLHRDAMNRPAEFRRDDVAVPHRHLAALPQRLDAVKRGMGYFDVIGIPQRRPAKLRHPAVADHQPMVMPERIAQVEIATLDLDTGAFFQGAFSVGGAVKRAIDHLDVLHAIQGALLIQCLLLNPFHDVPLPSCTTSVAS